MHCSRMRAWLSALSIIASGQGSPYFSSRWPSSEPALRSAAIVGISYFVGSAFPLLPVLFGAHTALWSILSAGTMILLVSMALAFLSGMDVKRRALTNLVIITVAAGVTYLIGMLVRNLLGIEI